MPASAVHTARSTPTRQPSVPGQAFWMTIGQWTYASQASAATATLSVRQQNCSRSTFKGHITATTQASASLPLVAMSRHTTRGTMPQRSRWSHLAVATTVADICSPMTMAQPTTTKTRPTTTSRQMPNCSLTTVSQRT